MCSFLSRSQIGCFGAPDKITQGIPETKKKQKRKQDSRLGPPVERTKNTGTNFFLVPDFFSESMLVGEPSPKKGKRALQGDLEDTLPL